MGRSLATLRIATLLGACLLLLSCVQTPAPSAPAAVYDATAPELPADLRRPAILVFSKTNGYRHADAIPAANALFAEIARARGWSVYFSENGAIANRRQLARFDAIVFNNVSGDVFTSAQRQALKTYIERGGGFVGVHGSGGDPSYAWRWYVESLIGAQFIGHTMEPQFQEATLRVDDRTHPAMKALPANLPWTEEWYSFAASARRGGYHVLASVDESTYRPSDGRRSLAMGADHPVIWQHCEGRGRAFYSALGHRGEAYAAPEYRKVLEGAVAWAARLEGEGCG